MCKPPRRGLGGFDHDKRFLHQDPGSKPGGKDESDLILHSKRVFILENTFNCFLANSHMKKNGKAIAGSLCNCS